MLRVFDENAGPVAAGTPLLEIGDVRSLEVVVDLLSTDAVRAVAGAEAEIDEWGGGRMLRGRVRRVEPSGFTKVSALGLEEQRVNVVVDVDDPRDAFATLGDSYRVEVRIVVWERSDALTVPATALFRSGSRWAVFVVERGRARLRYVDAGETNEVETEVLGGLSAGERVIVQPSDRVRDGVRVAARDGT